MLALPLPHTCHRFAVSASKDKDGSEPQLKISLEAELLDAAHIVFTTLNSAALPCLQGCAQFTVVVVDEAAQGVEPATLVPLRLGGRHCVLVGDPQQLSATVFSQGGAATQYDRSLFQRLEQCGHPVHLLDTQVRIADHCVCLSVVCCSSALS
jgi:senataxin